MLKLLIKEGSLEYLRMLTKMDLNKIQQDFYEWQLSQAQPVRVVSYKQVPDISKKLEQFLKVNKPKQKQCYMTATKCAMFINGVEYVEGLFSFSGIPIEHSWNYYKGSNFDLTSEVALKTNHQDYVQIIKLKKSLMEKYTYRNGVYGNLISSYYKDKILKEKK